MRSEVTTMALWTVSIIYSDRFDGEVVP